MQLPFEHRVPLHRKAARALLAIAPGSPEAETARAVLAGTWQVSAVATPVVPVRMRQRIDALLAELTDATADELRRRSAVDNLVALGAPAAVPVAMLLEPGCPAGVIQAALEVLTRLGKHAAPAVRRLTKVLFELPCDNTVAVMRALTATVPWSDDVFLPLNYLSSGDSLEIVGRKIQGTCDAAFLNAFREASDDFHIMGRVALDSSIDSLRELLTGRDPRMRRRALEVVVARAGDCVGLLDTLAPMMAEDQPKEPFSEWQPNGSVRTGMRDCSDRIHRLAANAILAVAPSNHPLLAKARERLAEQKR